MGAFNLVLTISYYNLCAKVFLSTTKCSALLCISVLSEIRCFRMLLQPATHKEMLWLMHLAALDSSILRDYVSIYDEANRFF